MGIWTCFKSLHKESNELTYPFVSAGVAIKHIAHRTDLPLCICGCGDQACSPSNWLTRLYLWVWRSRTWPMELTYPFVSVGVAHRTDLPVCICGCSDHAHGPSFCRSLYHGGLSLWCFQTSKLCMVVYLSIHINGFMHYFVCAFTYK